MRERDLSALKAKARQLGDGPGVYLMKDRLGSVLYVGKAKVLKRRVSSYFQPSRRLRVEQPKVAAMIELIHDFEVVEVRSESEALLLEGKLIKEWKPKYNTDFTDDKRFLLVKVEASTVLPRFRLVRFRDEDQCVYFGPFAHSGLLRKTLQQLRLQFGILLGDARPTLLEDGRWQLYEDMRAEIYGHSNVVSEDEYLQRVESACSFLEGKSQEWVDDLKTAMMEAAKDRNFERAAELRDILAALEGTTQKTRKFVRNPVWKGDASEPLQQLRDALGMREEPAAMECFDISHISGTFCVASMVRFEKGLPAKNAYRRYRIKSFVGNDDFRAMEEVVSRRYRRLHSEGKAFPDLVVIDGGVGQVSSALRAFLESGLEPPVLIGLAKKEEQVIFSDGREPLQLPGHHPGRLLLQRIRDEAHRFANSYNAELRRKKLRESVLMGYIGLGQKRRDSLLNHFGSFERLRRASAEEIQAVEGIGPKMAKDLRDWLQRQGE